MLENKLEILIITYNRADFLRRTLNQLQNSPFANCQITLLDNCSTDDTPLVYEEYQPLFPRLKVVRHPKNIGACANYLRAVELSQATYTWVLCDDDLFDFTSCGDVIEAIESEEFDLFSLGSPGQFRWERGLKTTSRELIRRGARFYGVFTFLPGVIFRTEKFDSECMAKGYRNIINSFPHFDFIKKAARENFKVYVSKHQIIHREGRETESLPGNLYHLRVWTNCVSGIEDPALRKAAMDRTAPTKVSWPICIGDAIVQEKLNRPQAVFPQIPDLMMGFGLRQRVILLLLSPLLAIPAPIYRMVRWVYRRVRHKPPIAAPQSHDFFRF